MSSARWPAAILIMAFSGTLLANEQTQQICAKAVAQKLTIPASAGNIADKELADCDEQTLYYGLGTAPDPRAALHCGYYQRAHPNGTNGDPFQGPGVLSMLYANGMGVPRDLDLAIRFSCENQWAAPAETEGRVLYFESMRASPSKVTFDLCDHATSGLMQGACTNIASLKVAPARDSKMAAIQAKWSPAVKSAFALLEKAERDFWAARLDEIDMSGTARAAFAIQEEDLQRDQLLINLRDFASGKIPKATPEKLASDNRDLDAAYRKAIESLKREQQGTVTAAAVETAQATWLKLRMAWVDFGRLAFPAVSSDRIQSRLTRQRIHQLRTVAS